MLLEFFSNAPANELSSTNAIVTYFVSGYVGRSVSFRQKSPSCKSLLISGHILHECAAKDYQRCFKNGNRGGSSEPSELCFTTTASAAQCSTVLSCDETRKTKFFWYEIDDLLLFLHL